MPIKLLMTWDIVPGREQEYFEFVIRELVPGMQRIGIQPTEAWFTQYGNSPQMLTGGVAENMVTMKKALESDDWRRLHDKLGQYVTNFNLKLVHATGGFQM